MLVYVAGPMRGYKYFNFPAFDDARDLLVEEGYDVISPADMDREHGFDACELAEDTDWGDYGSVPFEVGEAIERDIDALRQCDAIYLLKGWEGSKGAKAEKALAEWMGLKICYQENDDLPKSEPSYRIDKDVLEEALEITRGDRNTSYGPPHEDFTRTAEMATAMLRHKLQPGEKIEPWDVGHFMICVKLSRLQHRPKRDSVVDIAGYSRCIDDCYQSRDAYQSTPTG